MDKYLDIINLPHHQSLNHKRMNNLERAAQFAPFAALTGYDALIREMARTTQKKITLSIDKIDDINKKLSYLKNHLEEAIIVEIIYFKKDMKKEGGEYLSISGYIQNINEYHKYLKIDDINIKFSDIYSIDFNYINELYQE